MKNIRKKLKEITRLEKLMDEEFSLKIAKYIGYSMEVGGGCGFIYGIFSGDKSAATSGVAMAYFGTLAHRTFKFLQNEEEKSRYIADTKNNDKFSDDLKTKIIESFETIKKEELFEVVIDLPGRYEYDSKIIDKSLYKSIIDFAEEYQEPLIKEMENMGIEVTHRLFWTNNQIGADLTIEQLIQISKSQYIKAIRLD